ncbi:tyrosine-type recombinase/integrase [Nitratireductor sp. GCM10026969]|uniref:tyrosine-type recombinase/integrase n=1 Tax=Nitratireductor sp. GCM10026969 TaxID=3252645 RepID=UPI0036156C88
MPTVKLTRRSIQAIEKPEKPVVYYDESVKGFGLRVMPSGVRSWIIEYRPGAGGRGVAKKRVKIGDAATMSPEDAREKAGRTLARVTLGSDPATERADERSALSVAELAQLFLEKHVAEKRKANTERLYAYAINDLIVPAIGGMRAPLVTRADVARMQAAIVRARKNMPNGGKTAANRALAVLSAIYNWADREGLVPEGYNPVQRVEKYKENRKERFLTSEELAALGAALQEAETVGLPYEVDPDKPKSKHTPKGRYKVSPHAVGAVRLLILTGCRLREILDLRWAELDFERGIAFLADSKTGRKPIVLSAAAQEVLTALPRVGKFVVASESAGEKDEKPRSDLKRPWAAISKRAGLSGVRLHDLRHTYASIGAGGGLGLPVIGKLLGHSQASTTARYAHLDVDPVKRAADLISAKISTAMNGGAK